MNILKKYWVAAALVGIIAGAVFVRTYHFEEWLYFKMDQGERILQQYGHYAGCHPQRFDHFGRGVLAVLGQHAGDRQVACHLY